MGYHLYPVSETDCHHYQHTAEACSALVSDMQSFHVLAGSSDIRDLSNMHLRAGLLIVTHN